MSKKNLLECEICFENKKYFISCERCKKKICHDCIIKYLSTIIYIISRVTLEGDLYLHFKTSLEYEVLPRASR